MRRICVLFLLTILSISCSSAQRISPVGKPLKLAEIQEECNRVFPTEKWVFIHSIEANFPGEKKTFMLGVSQIFPEKKKIHCIMMTIEGLVVFDALYDGKIVINRGIPPFASENFAKGMISDLQLIFFQPKGQLIETGVSDAGEWICRYQDKKWATVDVLIHLDNRWTIRQYHRHQLRRTIKAYLKQDSVLLFKNRIPERLELIAHGVSGYSLKLKLVEAEPLSE
ncbi:MAG: hypothetical protein JRJ41_01715 [Deltaproteobacteria bacterium]|nr:hypothetical protein [Deltaproteobacteria bacterium]